ncbi:hypothetical protein K504DRAFT_530360 [Pleomassaria siparia CBS 279.74]|uniref:DUF7730 domain-containing protein n=1 Tax=Pleomassaria siparia CBS 279.74 TaxID=1314801 RepID=A0A6G1KKD5_9PLEO|nr:hypothetical protein K504DRAFT_530360 [Pleomassaria siparia CBS 279.74]
MRPANWHWVPQYIPDPSETKLTSAFKTIGLACLCAPWIIVISPVRCFRVVKKNRAQKKEKHRVDEELGIEFQPMKWPHPLPVRRHSLSAPSTPPHSTKIQDSAPQVFGFLKLPVEIRLSIYEMSLEMEGKCVRLVAGCKKEKRRGQYQLESYWGGIPAEHEFRLNVRYHPYSNGRLRTHTEQAIGITLWAPFDQGGMGLRIMNLLLTCRALYTDVLAVVYNNCTFYLTDLDTLHIFSRAIPALHFNAIQSLHLDCRYIGFRSSFTTSISHFPKAYRHNFSIPKPVTVFPELFGLPDVWSAACSVLANMQGLRELRVKLCHSAFSEVLFRKNPEVLIANEDFVFEPLMAIRKEKERALEIFEVEVDWPSSDQGWDGKDTAFEITRTGPRKRGW